MTKSLQQIINDYELGKTTIYKNEHVYIELSKQSRVSDNIELYFSIDDDVITETFKNKCELLDKTILNKKSMIYPFQDELLSNDDVVSLKTIFVL